MHTQSPKNRWNHPGSLTLWSGVWWSTCVSCSHDVVIRRIQTNEQPGKLFRVCYRHHWKIVMYFKSPLKVHVNIGHVPFFWSELLYHHVVDLVANEWAWYIYIYILKACGIGILEKIDWKGMITRKSPYFRQIHADAPNPWWLNLGRSGEVRTSHEIESNMLQLQSFPFRVMKTYPV